MISIYFYVSGINLCVFVHLGIECVHAAQHACLYGPQI